MRTGKDWLLNAIPSRLNTQAEGLDGGEPGATGSFLINGEPSLEAKKRGMGADDLVMMQTPGGGGYGRA